MPHAWIEAALALAACIACGAIGAVIYALTHDHA